MSAALIIACITATPIILGLLAVAALLLDLLISGRDRWQDPPSKALASIAFRLCATEAELAACAALNRADIATQPTETQARLRAVFADRRAEIRKESTR